ncbi:MAG: type II toxin-antitoxin system VapC family toxin [Candidatus Binataceae bacterium]
MAKLMLGTDICIDVMRERSPGIRRHLERTTPDRVAISSIVAAELWTGAMKSREPQAVAAAITGFFAFVTILDWPAAAAEIYGKLRAKLERAGQLIGAIDMLIAAHALHEQATLVTRNQAEFRRVTGLKLQSWSDL